MLNPYHQPARTSSEYGIVLASYNFAAEASTTVLAEEALTLIAEIYVAARRELVRAIAVLQLPAADF